MDLGLGGDGGDEGLGDAVDGQQGDVEAVQGEDAVGAGAEPAPARDDGQERGGGEGPEGDDYEGEEDVEAQKGVKEEDVLEVGGDSARERTREK